MPPRSLLSSFVHLRNLFSSQFHRNPRKCSPHLSPLLLTAEKFLCRPLSSGTLPVDSSGESPSDSDDDLKSRIFRLRFPKRSATNALQRWINEGNKVTLPELRQISKELRKSQRYKHALEISEWMVTHQEFELSDHDYALRIDLITKVFGINAAEEFFEGLPSTAKNAETYTALLHSYAAAKQTEKAEGLFERIKESGLTLDVLAYNEIMTLYTSIGQLDKVSVVVEELKMKKVAPDLFTYNVWASACAAALDIDGVRKVLEEMSSDSNSNRSWKTYITLTNIYLSTGHLSNWKNSPFESDNKISQREWITYDFLIILFTGLGNREKVSEIWKSLKMTKQKMTTRNYSCIFSSFVMLGNLKEAGEVIDEWRQSIQDFDVSACNKLSDAFAKAGLTEKTELIQDLLLQKDIDQPH